MKFISVLSLILFTGLFLNAQEWHRDIDEAQRIAKEKNKNILLVFSGSDWCAPCIKLDKKILSSEEFTTYANENLVLVKADFPRKKKNRLSKEQQNKNNELAEKYNKQGFFPLLVVLDPTTKVLGSTGYKNLLPKEYITLLSSL